MPIFCYFYYTSVATVKSRLNTPLGGYFSLFLGYFRSYLGSEKTLFLDLKNHPILIRLKSTIFGPFWPFLGVFRPIFDLKKQGDITVALAP